MIHIIRLNTALITLYRILFNEGKLQSFEYLYQKKKRILKKGYKK